MLRNVAAVVVGLFVGGLLNFVILEANLVLFPALPGTDLGDEAQLAAYVATLPVAAWLVAMLAHLAQAFGGGWIAARLGSAPMPLALVVGGLSAVAGVFNLVSLAAPTWMWLELPLYFGVAWLAGTLEVRRRST